jgi:hypothetical protein
MFNRYKKLIVIALVVALVLFGIFYLKGGEENPQTSLLQRNETESPDVLLQDIRQAIGRIGTIQLNTQIFSDPVLRNLIDHSKPINDEPVGRRNPFEALTTEVIFDSGSSDDSGTAEI